MMNVTSRLDGERRECYGRRLADWEGSAGISPRRSDFDT
jgi:hypothetical protein